MVIKINNVNYDEIIKNIASSLKENFKILLDRAKFDKTFKAKIIDKISENKYQILYRGQKHTVTSDSTLSVNQIVKVCAPQNNWSELFVVNYSVNGGVSGDYIPKSAISTTQVNDSNKVPSSSLVYSMNNNLNTAKTDITNIKNDITDTAIRNKAYKINETAISDILNINNIPGKYSVNPNTLNNPSGKYCLLDISKSSNNNWIFVRLVTTDITKEYWNFYNGYVSPAAWDGWHEVPLNQKEINTNLDNKIYALDRLLYVEDTREDNQPPSWYYKSYSRRTYVEFKLASALGLSDPDFGILFTITGWYDLSVNTSNQMLLYKNKIATRYALSDDTWSEWNKVVDKIDQNASSNNNIGKVFYGTELTKETSNRWIDNIVISLDVGVYIVEGQINISKQGASITAKLISPSSELGRQSVYSQDNNIYSVTITKTVVITTKSNITLQSWSNNGTQALYVALKATKIK